MLFMFHVGLLIKLVCARVSRATAAVMERGQLPRSEKGMQGMLHRDEQNYEGKFRVSISLKFRTL